MKSKPMGVCGHRVGAGHSLCRRCSSALGHRAPMVMQSVRKARRESRGPGLELCNMIDAALDR